MAPRLVLVAMACALLTSCETLETSAAPCSQGDGEPVPWTMLQEPPANALSYMQMAIADDTIGNRWSYWRSIWFAGPDGEIMLCRVGAGLCKHGPGYSTATAPSQTTGSSSFAAADQTYVPASVVRPAI